MSHPVIEPRGYVRGGFGEEMDLACLSITSHFVDLPGWQESRVDPLEVVHLAGFFAFIALASSPSAPLPPAEAATGAKATVARRLMLQGTPTELLNKYLRRFRVRLNEYYVLWVGVLKGTNSFGAFASLAFETVQAGDRTRQGYLEHLNAFPAFCERTIHAFHSTRSTARSAEADPNPLPTDLAGIKEQARKTEARLTEALRTLAEVGSPDAPGALPGDRARHDEALARIREAKQRLEGLSALLDTLDGGAKR